MASLAACTLQPGFSYHVDAQTRWSAWAALPFGPVCEEHRWKLTPTCTWRSSPAVDLACPPCGPMRGLSARYSRFAHGDRDYLDLKLMCLSNGAMRLAEP